MSPPAAIVIGIGSGATGTGGGGTGDMLAATWDTDSNGAIDVAKGGTNATSAASARANLGAAASGANNDITSLTGLTTPVDVTEGGTGAATAAGARTNLGLGSGAPASAPTASVTVIRDAAGRAQFADPSAAQDAATKAYVDALINGVEAKAACQCGSTANLTLSGEQTIDGFTTSGSRVLVKNQSSTLQNGIYLSAAGAWSRVTDMDTWTEVPGAFVFVESGTLNGSTGWVNTSAATGTIGVTAVTWTQFSGAGTYTAGTGLVLTGTQFTPDFGTAAGKVAQGNDSRITGALQAANNLSDVTAATARTNLGLGGLATVAVPADVAQTLFGDGAFYALPFPWAKLCAIFDDFLGGIGNSAGAFSIVTTGSGAGHSVGTGDATSIGIITGATGTTTTGSARLGGASSGFLNTITLGVGVAYFEARIRIPTLSNGTDTFTIRLGMNDNSSGGDATDGVYLRYTDGVNSGKFQLVTRSNSTETATDTGVTVVANTWYKVKLTVNAAGTSVSCDVNGTVVTASTNIPTTAARATGLCSSIAKSAGTTSLTWDVDYIGFTLNLTTAR